MENKFNRFLSLLLAVVMVVGMMPISTVFAAENDDISNVIVTEPENENSEGIHAENVTEPITGTITENATWNDGDVIGGVTISGNVTITVKGTVTVTGTIRLNPDAISNVTFNGEANAMLIRGSEFTGQMFYAEGVSGNFQNLTFNNITLDGGAVWTGDVDKTLNRGETNEGVTATGSVLYLVYANADLNYSVLQNHDDSTGEKANAVFLRYYSTIDFNNSVVRNNNSVSSYYSGGVITVRQGGTVKTNNTEVYGNFGTQGGFFGTSSTGSYGGIVEVYNSKFHHNYAGSGAVFDMQCSANKGYLLIDGCEFYENASVRGLIYEHAYSRPVTIKDSYFHGNECAVWDCHTDPVLNLSGKIVIEEDPDYTGYLFETPLVLGAPLADGSSIPLSAASLAKLGNTIITGTTGYNVTEADLTKLALPEGYKLYLADINGDGIGDVVSSNDTAQVAITLTLKDMVDASASEEAIVYSGLECLPINPFAHEGLIFAGWIDASGKTVAKQNFAEAMTLTATWKLVTPIVKLSREGATLKVVVANASDDVAYSYQWYMDNVAIEGATAATYTMTDVNSHNYKCEVTASKEGFASVTGNASGNSSAPAAAQIGETKYGSLKEAVAAANAIAEGATITLIDDVILGEKLTIARNVTISGEHTITRADTYTGTLFEVAAGATLTLDGGLTIDGGNKYVFDRAAFDADAADYNKSIATADSAKWFTPVAGAPVATAFMITTTGGTVNLNNVTIQNNYSISSGVISAGANSTITLTGAKITHVAATQGNGVVANVSGANIKVTVNEGTLIDGNHVGGNHGLFKVYSGATLTMEGGEITNNTGWNSNGTVVGIYWATFNLKGGLICSNTGVYGPSNGRNAAIYGHSGHTFVMTGGTICHNSGRARGGIDAPYDNGTTLIKGGEVLDNISRGNGATYDVLGTSAMQITGGTFTQDVSQWLAPNTGLVYDEATGTFGVVTKNLYKLHLTDPTTGEPATIPYLEGNDLASLVATGKLFYANYYEMELEVLYDVKINEPVVIDYPMTINLNGHTITGVNIYPVIRVQGGADVTVKNGTIVNGDYVFVLGASDGSSKGNLTIESGTYTGETTVASVTKGTLTINGGIFAVTDETTYLLNCIDANYRDGSANIIVNGGSFKGFNPADNAAEGADTNFCADGSMVTEANGIYTVAKPVAEVNGMKYSTLPGAIAAAQNGETVKLIADITYTDADVVNAIGGATGFGQYPNPCIIYVGGTAGTAGAPNTPSAVNAVIDLNGHTIKNTADAYFIMIMDNAKVVFTDSVGGGKVITTADAPAVWVIGTETLVTIEGGYFETASAGGVLHTTHGGDLVIKGGEFNTTAENKSLLIMMNSKDRQNSKFFISGVATVTINGGIFHGFNPAKVGDDNGATSIEDIKFVDGCEEGYTPVENGDGTYGVEKKTVVTIGSAQDLIDFSKAVGNAVSSGGKYQGIEVHNNPDITVKLTADIDMKDVSGFWPIGDGNKRYFAGTFDGQGHTISNLYCDNNWTYTNAFFRTLGLDTTIKNITFDNAYFGNGAATKINNNYAVVVGCIGGAADIVFDNVKVINSTVKGNTTAGIFVGRINGSDITIKNSAVNNCTIIANGIWCGAFVGYVESDDYADYNETENNSVEKSVYIVDGESKTLLTHAHETTTDHTESTYVAQIGDKKYSTLFDAIAAAQDGDTITLIGDVVLNTFRKIEKSITLDLGKYNITRENGTALYVDGNVEVVINGTTGKVTGHQALFVNSGLVQVNGGAFHGSTEAVYVINTGKVEIYGGTFSASGEAKFVLNEYDATREATSITVYGGTFVGFNPADNAAEGPNTNFVAENYAAIRNADGTYSVKKTVATIDSVEDLLSFAAAVTGNKEYKGIKVAANPNAVVLLTADLDLTDSGFVGIGNGAANAFSGTFDGQGHTISNMTLSCDYYRGVGFFRSLGKGAVVKNVTFVNANVNNGAGTAANHFYGVLVGFSNNLTVDNVDVKDSSVTCKYAGGVIGGCLEGATVIKDSDVENVTLTTTDIRAAVYGIIGNSANGHTLTTENNTINNAKLIIDGELKQLSETVEYGSWNAGQDYAESTYVAQIGDKKYSTLTAAIKAAQNSDIITLIGNVELVESIVVPAGKTITLDLNGKTISQKKACTASYEMINNKGNLTITGNGKISFTDTSAGDPSFGWGSYTIRNEGTLVVENGTIEHKGTQAFAKHMICAIFQYSGSTTINGGTISTPNYRSVRLWKGDMTINGGTFDGQVWVQAVDNSAKLTINGGTFGPNGGDASSVFVSNETYTVEFAVTGGTFNGKIGVSNASKLAGCISGGKFTETAKNGTNEVLIAKGYKFEANADNTYTVAPNMIFEFHLTDKDGNAHWLSPLRSNTIEGAMEKAKIWYDSLQGTYDFTLKIMDSCELDQAILVNFPMTLDLNGYTISGTGAALFQVASTLTLVDSSEAKTGKIEHYGEKESTSAIAVSGGELIINSGSVISNHKAIQAGGTGKTNAITINGGVINGTDVALNLNKGTNTVKITGGNLVGNNAVHVSSQATVAEFTISNGTFEGNMRDIPEGKLTITGGTFSVDVSAYCANGYICEAKDGKFIVREAHYVAEVNGVKYESLQDAIAAAQNGATVTLIADAEIKGVTSDASATVTIDANANVTINLNGKNLTLTSPSYGTHALTVNGKLTIRGEGNVKVMPFANLALGIKVTGTLTIEGGTYSSEKGNIGSVSGTLVINGGSFACPSNTSIFNTGSNCKITVTAGEFSHAPFAEREEDSRDIKISGGSYGDDLPEEWIVEGKKQNAEGEVVDYFLFGSGTAADPYIINNTKDLIFFRNSVNNGETKYNAAGVYVVLTADIDLADINWVGIGSATAEHGFMGNFDGNGFKIKNLTITNPALDADGYAYAGLFAVTEGVDANNQNVIKNLVIENVTIETTGHIVAAAIAYPYYTIVENVTVCGNIDITGGDYTAGALAYTRRCVNASNVTVSGNAGSTITGASVVGGVISDIQMNGGLKANYSNFSASGLTISGENMVGGISGIIATQTLNGATVKNVKLEGSDSRVGIVAGCFGGTSTISNVTVENVTGADVIIGSNYDGKVAVQAKVGDTYYGTLEAALAATEAGDTITLLTPYVVEAGEEATIDLAGKTIAQSVECTKSYEMILNKGKLTILDSVGGGKISFTDTSAGDPSFGWGSYTIRNEGTLVVENGTIEHKGTQAFAKHMICAIFQYSGSTTINGGTISTPNYRSVRLWKGDMTINGGTFDGQVWVQAVDNSAKLTINGGTFEPNGGDASSVFVSNATYTVAFAVTDGTFNGKIGVSNAAQLAGCISGGKFTETAKNGTNAALLKENFVFTEEADANGYFTIREAHYVAEVNGKKYESLQEAIAAAQNGETVKLIADITVTETVTVPAGKTITLDLNGKTISQKKAQTAGYQMILNDGNLTINDSVGGGKISYTDSGNGGEYISDTIYNRGTLIINGGTIENLSSATVAANGYPHAVDTYSGIRDTSVTINGGTIYCAEYSAIRMFCVSATNKADLVINGGTIKGAVDMQNGTKDAALGSLTINDGTFEITKNANNIRFANWNGGATEYGISASIKGGSFNGGITTQYVPATANWNSKIISGGTFSVDVNQWCAPGYYAKNNGDGTWTVQEGIKMKSATLLYEDMIQIRYKVDVSCDEAVKYGLLIFADKEDAQSFDIEKAVQHKELKADSDGFFYGYTDGIPAKEMGDSQFAVAYIELSDGSIIFTSIVEYSPKIYAQRMVNKATTKPETVALCNALMQYGAAAQMYMNYKTTDLMNEGFATVEYDASVLGENIFKVDTTETNGFKTKAANLLFEGALTYRVKYVANDEITGKKLYAEYTVKGQTGSVDLRFIETDNAWYAYISGIAAKDMDEKIVIKPYYIDDNGNKVYGAELVYSGYEYSRRKADSENVNAGNLAKAFAMYIDAVDKALKKN